MNILLSLLITTILYLPFIGQYTNTQIQVIYDSNNNGRVDDNDLRLENVVVEITAYDNDNDTPNLHFSFITGDAGKTIIFNPVYPSIQIDVASYTWVVYDVRSPIYQTLIPWSSQ